MRGSSSPQESIFPALAAKLYKFALHVFIYIQNSKAIPKGDNQIHAGINTLESDRHEIIACIARASIGNSIRILGFKTLDSLLEFIVPDDFSRV